MDINSTKTLSLRTVGIKIPAGGGEFLGKTVAILSGQATGHFLKSTSYGESIALQGDFVMLNAITGEVFEGVNLYMPDDFAKSVATKLDKSVDGGHVEFKNVEIVCAASEKSARGYTFIVRNLQTVETVNARKVWATEMLAGLKALPAPDKKKTTKAA